MAIDAKLVMQLRNETSAGVNDCRKALEEAQGDFPRAKDLLKQWGKNKGEALANRAATQGRIAAYVHGGDNAGRVGKGGALVELSCETDFVAKSDPFVELARDLAVQVYGFCPKYVRRDQVPPEAVEAEKAKHAEELKGKPADIAAKVLDEKMKKTFFAKQVLLDMPFYKDESTSVEDVIKSKIAACRENIVIRRFARFEIGV